MSKVLRYHLDTYSTVEQVIRSASLILPDGCLNHILIDVKNKFIWDYDITPASQHDSQVFEELLDEDSRIGPNPTPGVVRRSDLTDRSDRRTMRLSELAFEVEEYRVAGIVNHG